MEPGGLEGNASHPQKIVEIGFLWHKFESKIGDKAAKGNVIENLGIFTFYVKSYL